MQRKPFGEIFFGFMAILILFLGCEDAGNPIGTDSDLDTDTDSDTDGDSDTDSDLDSDTDLDSDSDLD
jgi:hypothetical protein